MALRSKGKGAGSPAWMTTFADLMALMLTFFVLLLSMSNTDTKRYAEALASIQRAFVQMWPTSSAPPGAGKGGQTIGERSAIIKLPPPPTAQEPVSASPAPEQPEPVQERSKPRQEPHLLAEIRGALQPEIDKQLLDVEERAGNVVIRFQERVSFPSGSAELNPVFTPILDKVAALLAKLHKQVVVVGHTDDRPINSPVYRSNWDLSSARAASVVHYLLGHADIAPNSIVAEGRADSVPLEPNDSVEHRARNRRVEVVFRE